MVQTVLLTGGSGVVGQALLRQLADINVVCLTRQRPLNDSIVTIPGDIRMPRLGLDAKCYHELAERVDWVIHAAAVTDFARPLEELRRCNVGGVRNMLAFAGAAQAPMIHISTAFVLQRHGHSFNHYEVSKREAEELVRQSGLPVTIVRPSIVIGDSQTGFICKQQGIHRMIRLLIEGVLPAVPGSANAMIDFVPQDRVAAAIVGLLRHQIIGGEYWLTAGEAALSLDEGLEILATRATALLQRVVRKPRLVTQIAFEHMVQQECLATPAARRQQLVAESMGLFKYLTMGDAFASSFALLGAQIGVDALPDPRLTFQRNLDYIIRYNQTRLTAGG